jgi:hypothetical protein
MESVRQEVGPRPTVRIATVDGDLRVTGRAGTRLEAQAGSRGGLLVQPRGDVVEITCRSGCLLFLPEASSVVVERASGDVRLSDLSGDLRLGDVAGDLSLRHVGPTRVERVGGGLAARRMEHGLRAGEVAGEARLEHMGGQVSVDNLGGDLRASQLDCQLEVRLSGDAWLDWSPPGGSTSSVRAAGDVVCRFRAAASAEVSGRAAGDVRMLGDHTAGPTKIRLGAGEATVDLDAGGDLRVTQGGTEMADGLAEEISAQVEATLADVEAGLEGMDMSAYGIDTQDLRHKVHRALSRALRRARQGPEEAAAEAPAKGASDEERLAILRMLEEGKINVEQAESLLRALEPGG